MSNKCAKCINHEPSVPFTSFIQWNKEILTVNISLSLLRLSYKGMSQVHRHKTKPLQPHGPYCQHTFYSDFFSKYPYPVFRATLKLRSCNLPWYILKVVLWYILGEGVAQCQGVFLPCVGLCVSFFSIPPQTYLLLLLLLSRHVSPLSPCRDLHPVPVHYQAKHGKIHRQALWSLTE